jgi:uncharacterized membrane protein
MTKSRLEAFSDGVLAIVITIMVLELRTPADQGWRGLLEVLPELGLYTLSFAFVGIYWNNHHHLLQAVAHVNGPVLWANLHLLFWLSLVPFVTAWMGENNFAALPMAAYGVVLLMSAVAFTILVYTLIALHGRTSALAMALGRDYKGKTSLVCYALAIPLAFVSPWLAGALYVFVAILWLVPDTRIEKTLFP